MLIDTCLQCRGVPVGSLDEEEGQRLPSQVSANAVAMFLLISVTQ